MSIGFIFRVINPTSKFFRLREGYSTIVLTTVCVVFVKNGYRSND